MPNGWPFGGLFCFSDGDWSDGWPRDSTNTQVFEKIMSGRGCVDFDAVSGVEWFADCAAIWVYALCLADLFWLRPRCMPNGWPFGGLFCFSDGDWSDGWPRDSTNTQVFEKIMSGRGCVDFDAVSGVEWFADCAAIWVYALCLADLFWLRPRCMPNGWPFGGLFCFSDGDWSDGWPRDSTNTQVFEKIMLGRGCVDFDAVSGVEWFADCAAIWVYALCLADLFWLRPRCMPNGWPFGGLFCFSDGDWSDGWPRDSTNTQVFEKIMSGR